MPVELRVLGPIEVSDDGRRLAVAAGRQLAILAFLVIHANRVVSAERIVDELWGDEPPDTGVKAVAFHVSRLRDALEPGRPRGKADGIIATEPGGYVLRIDPDAIDAVRFERLAAEARAILPDDPDAARTRFAEALDLWRGAPYADVADERFVGPEIARLEELRLRFVEDRVDADMAVGRDTEVIDELAAVVAENPLRERARGQLMVALYRAGRQAEALRAYGEGRRVLADELGIDPGPELQQLEGWILRQDPRLEQAVRRRIARNPFKGLRPFDEEDTGDFFGREALVARLIERLGQVARVSRFLALVGPSGSGKSSVVRAGLLPAVRAGALPGSERWPIAVMQPGTRPFRELAAALREVDPGDPADLGDRLELDGDIAGAVAGIAEHAAHVLLVVDQLEELFALVPDEAERLRFVDALVGALVARDGRLVVVATLRADFLAGPLLAPGLGELLRVGTELATPLSRDELERAIVRPAEAVGVQLEPGLAAEVIAEVARQPGELPLLQYALTELFERSDGRRLTRAGFEAIGGVLGALGRRAEEVHAGLDPEGREVARQLFLRLVVAGEPGQPTARRVPRAEILAVADDMRRVDEVIDAFGRARLLSFDRDAATGEPTVQVAHEALLARWERLATWIDEERDDLRLRRRLAEAAADWTLAGRDPGFLLAGSRLDLFASWAATTDLRLNAPERELLDASLAERRSLDDAAAAHAAHERVLERRSATRLQALVAVLAIAVLVVTGLLVAVYGQGEASREQAEIAAARELAAGSIGSLGTDPGLSLLLAWQAADATATRGYVVDDALDALHWALQASHVPYPAGEAQIAVRSSPDGPRGVPLIAPERLMELAAGAAGAAGRELSPEECRTYLHRDSCPPPGASVEPDRSLEVRTSSGVGPVEALAGGSPTRTGVDVVAQLPADLAPLVDDIEAAADVDVTWTTDTGEELASRIAAGDLPDVAIVERPADVADLAERKLLVDLSGWVDAGRLRAVAGDYLVGLATVGADGTWPTADGALYGAPFAAEVESMVWYPKTAFVSGAYDIPGTAEELSGLAARLIAGGRFPWCLGAAEGSAARGGVPAGGSAVDIVEEVVLQAAGPDVYDAWSEGRTEFADEAVGGAFSTLGSVARGEGVVQGGVATVLATPRDLAGWPQFSDPPGCWLHLAGGSDRRAWPRDSTGVLDAFPFPAYEPARAGTVRGRVFTIVVFHDRPEVRRLVGELLGENLADRASPLLVPAGAWPLGQADGVVAAAPERTDGELLREGNLLWTALRAGTFRVAASDLMPARVASAFADGTIRYLAGGDSVLAAVLRDIDRTWRAAR